MYAVHPDGTENWAFQTEGCVQSSPAIGADGALYVGSMNGNGFMYADTLFAVNPDGTLRWSLSTMNWIDSSPAIGTDGTIYAGCEDGNLYAVDANGYEQWACTLSSGADSSPAIGADGTIYLGTEDGNLYAVDTHGNEQWAYATGNEIDSSPAIGVDGTIYVGADDNKLYAINPDGTLQWVFATGSWIASSPALGADGTIYVASSDGNLYAVYANGAQRWAFPIGSGSASSPALGTDGTLYTGSWSNDCLYAITSGYTITPSVSGDGTISPNTPQEVAPGSTLTLTATPNTGYTVNSWSVDGMLVQTGGTTYTLTDITANHSVVVSFTQLALQCGVIERHAGVTAVDEYPHHADGHAHRRRGAGAVPFPGGLHRCGGLALEQSQYRLYDHGELQLTPAAAGSYTLVVWARIVGHTANYDHYATLAYQITIPPFTAVVLKANPASPQPANTAIALTASPTGGGGQVQYLFRVGYTDAAGWHWSNLNAGYTSTASCNWTPAAAGSYTLVVWARIVGHTVNYDHYATLAYQVTIPPLTAVALKANPASPQPANTAITLTASPTGGGGQVQYLFRAGYTDAAGWHWSNLNAGYTSTASCNWTPAAAGSYTLVVWARIVGHTANYDHYATLAYQITIPPFTAVALKANPASPQPANTAITLTASPTGGGEQVQYLFRAGYTDAAGWHWSNLNAGYTSTASCNWTPAAAGSYTLVVWARLLGHTVNYDEYAAINYQVTNTTR